MGHRTVRYGGAEWQVWDVRPAVNALAGRPSGDGSGLPQPWLCMESGTEKRRIVPIPEGWEEWPDGELAARIATAPVVERSGRVTSQVGDGPAADG